MQFTLASSYAQSGSDRLTATDTILADGVAALDVSVPAGTTNQKVSLAVDVSRLQGAYLVSNQPVTIKAGGVNAVQSVTIGGGATGGTFTLTWGGFTTSAIAWNAAASAVQTALAALSSIGTGNVSVTGSAGAWSVEFKGALAVAPRATLTGSGASLTGGTPTLTPASVTTGVVPDQTFSFAASIPLAWSLQAGYFANPITQDVADWFVTNPGTVAATVNFRFPLNAA